MKTATKLRLMAVLAIGTTCAFASAAQATTPVTFVSILGNDSNTATNCTSGNPCRNFSTAYSITTAGGEIIALDTGNFGSLAITGAITIVANQLGIITVGASATGITIAAGSGTVILRNIELNGGGRSSTIGISLTSGKLILDHVRFEVLTTGLSVTNSLADVYNSDFMANGTAITASGAGPASQTSGGTTEVRVWGGSVLASTVAAFNMVNPGSNETNILEGVVGSSSYTDVAGNPMPAVTGTGTGCPGNCSELSIFSFFDQANNQP